MFSELSRVSNATCGKYFQTAVEDINIYVSKIYHENHHEME